MSSSGQVKKRRQVGYVEAFGLVPKNLILKDCTDRNSNFKAFSSAYTNFYTILVKKSNQNSVKKLSPISPLCEI